MQYGRLLFHLRRFADASAEFERARKADPYFAVASAWAGHLQSLTGRNPQAVLELERALEIDSLNPPGLFMFAQALLRAGQRDSARAVADRLVRSFPAWRTAAGVLYGMLGERAMAEATLRDLATADSVVAGRYSTMVMVALSIRDTARALDALERATAALEPWPTWGGVSDHHFGPLVGSARYSAVLRRVGLDEQVFNARAGGFR